MKLGWVKMFIVDGETNELKSHGVDAGVAEDGEWNWVERKMVSQLLKHSTYEGEVGR